MAPTEPTSTLSRVEEEGGDERQRKADGNSFMPLPCFITHEGSLRGKARDQYDIECCGGWGKRIVRARFGRQDLDAGGPTGSTPKKAMGLGPVNVNDV